MTAHQRSIRARRPGPTDRDGPTPPSSVARPTRDLYATVTDQIIAAIESGAATYSFPWHHVPGPPQNFISRRPYRGINTLLLWLTGHAQGYATPYWATFNQWRDVGHAVRKGEKASTIIFWQSLSGGGAPDTQQDTHISQDTDQRRPFVARAYSVFNVAQVADFTPPDCPILDEATRNAAADYFFNSLPFEITHDGDQAFYQPSTDRIHLPPYARFKDANAYYATRGHESVHATGAPARLSRDLSGRFGTDAYAMEELIAELGAAFLCADLGLSPEPRPDHAGYIQSWLKVLRGDTRAIFTAAGKAQAAVDWLHAKQSSPATPSLFDQAIVRETDTGRGLDLPADADHAHATQLA